MGHLRRVFAALLRLDDTPDRIALAFGIGVWIAFFPVLGVHTLMALGVGFAFGLSRAALLIGTYVNNPWTIAPIYLAGTALGCWTLGIPLGRIGAMFTGYAELSRDALIEGLTQYLLPFVVGNLALGVLAGCAGYAALRWALRRRAEAARSAP